MFSGIRAPRKSLDRATNSKGDDSATNKKILQDSRTSQAPIKDAWRRHVLKGGAANREKSVENSVTPMFSKHLRKRGSRGMRGPDSLLPHSSLNPVNEKPECCPEANTVMKNPDASVETTESIGLARRESSKPLTGTYPDYERTSADHEAASAGEPVGKDITLEDNLERNCALNGNHSPSHVGL